MSIYPKGVSPENLSATFEYAALNLPVPESLVELADAYEWRAYLGNLPPAQIVRSFGQALDQLHQLIRANDPSKLPEDKQALVFSKWYAASVANALLQPKFHFVTQEMDRKNFLPLLNKFGTQLREKDESRDARGPRHSARP